jgi:transposase-like protein
MPPRMAPDKRAAILADIQARTFSRNEIARRHGVAPSAVGKIAAQEGITDAWDRTHALKGARAKKIDNAAKRAQLQSDLLDDGQRVRARIWGPYKVVVSGPNGAEIVELDEAPLEAIKAGFTAIGIIVDKDRAYEKDAQATGDSSAAARSLIGRLSDVLEQAAGTDSLEPPETPQE